MLGVIAALRGPRSGGALLEPFPQVKPLRPGPMSRLVAEKPARCG